MKDSAHYGVKMSKLIVMIGMKLSIRGSSFSIVELPTFLSSPVQLGCINTSSSTTSPGITLSQAIAESSLNTKGATVMQKKSQWIIIIVALSFFTTCMILVGTMLSVETDYQD